MISQEQVIEPAREPFARTMLEAALLYASIGWPVFPVYEPIFKEASKWDPRTALCSCGSGECSHPGKHPRIKGGLNSASTDSGQVRKWWHRWPDANIGVRCGRESGIVVMDVDGSEGQQSLDAVLRESGVLPETLTARSGGGGLHYFFKHPGVGKVSSNNGLRPGLDRKGDGGFIIVAPSRHISGGHYAWVTPFDVGKIAGGGL